jgi:hypothetical protein
MALTTEQQASVDVQVAIENARHANQVALQEIQQANQITNFAAQQKLDAVRLAQQTLIENARTKPVDEREITPADIATFASTLVTAINA